MSESTVVAIARIPLARSMRRLLIAPILLLALAAAAAVSGALLLPDWVGWALMGAAALPVLAAIYLVAVVVTVRLDVEVSTMRLRWVGTDRRYTLSRGAVTRVPLRGERAAKLRPRLGAFGWGLGTARLRGEETIVLVRLARSTAVILVPTDAGRVAVAPRSEEQFLEALAAAARVQLRLDQVAARARAIPIARLPEVVEAASTPEPAPEQPARQLTGIERTLLEERLAAERAAALAAAEEERRAAERAVALSAEAAGGAAEPAPEGRGAAPETRRMLPRPTLPKMALRRPRIAAPALPRGRLVSLALAALPVVAAAGIWGAGLLLDALPAGEARVEQLSVGLALGGPAGALAALAARAWFPRLTGLVIVTAACALMLVGRALFS